MTEEYKTRVCVAADEHSTHGSRVMRRTTLLPTRGRIRWRHDGDCRSDMIRRQEEEIEEKKKKEKKKNT